MSVLSKLGKVLLACVIIYTALLLTAVYFTGIAL